MLKSNKGKSGQGAGLSGADSCVWQWTLGQVSEEIFPSCKINQLRNLILNAMEGVIVYMELKKELKLFRLFKYFQKFTMGKSAMIYFRGCCLYVYYTIRTREVWGPNSALISHQMFHLKKTGHVSRLVLHKKRDTQSCQRCFSCSLWACEMCCLQEQFPVLCSGHLTGLFVFIINQISSQH